MRVTLTLVLVAAAFAVALIDPHGSRAATARAMASGASGALRIANSSEGRAVLAAGGLRPGATVTGTVTVGNAGQVAGRFSVRPSGLTDTPGAAGGELSQRLQLRLTDVTTSRVLYTGTPAGLTAVDVGDLAAGETHTYQLTATFPSGADDNDYQGAAVSFGLRWAATAAEPTATATPNTPPAPTAPAPTAPKAAALADTLGLPGAKRCLGSRLKVHVRTPDHAKLVSAKLRAGKRTATATARRPTATLSRLPHGRITVSIQVRTAAKHIYRASRTYKSCAKAR